MLKYVALNLNIGLHSLRSEGTSRLFAAISDLDERFIYKGKVSTNMYIKDSIAKRLQLSIKKN